MTTRALPRRPAVRPPKPVPDVIPPKLGLRFGAEANKSCVPVGFDPEAGQHLLIAGPPGSGKSTVIRSVLDGSLVAGCAAYVATASDCADYAQAHNRLSGHGTGLSGAERVLKAAVTEMESRQEQMAEQNKRRYDRLDPAAPPILVAVDGVLELLRMDLEIGNPANMRRAAVGSMLDAIAQHGAKAGLSLLIASRAPAGALIADRLFPHLHDLAETAARLTLHSPSVPGRGLWTAVDRSPVEVQADFTASDAGSAVDRRPAVRTG